MVSTRPTEQRQGPTPIRLGPIESSKVEVPHLAEAPSANRPVEIIRAYQKYPTDDQIEHFPSSAEPARVPIDPSSVTKPKVLENMKNVNLIEGGQALFDCRLQGHPLSVQWYKGDTEIKNQFRHKITYDERTGVARLLINTVLEDDAGIYTCRASNSVGEVTTSAKLAHAGIYLNYCLKI